MTRGRGYGGPRGGSFRGSNRGNSSWGGGGRAYGGFPRGRFSSPFSTSSPYDSRKYGSSDRYPPSRHSDDFRRSYRPESSYGGRDMGRSPDRKRSRQEAPSSRHDSYGGYGPSRYESSYSERRSPPSMSRRSDFRRLSGPPPRGGGYRGRISSRGSRGMKIRDRPIRRRLVEGSYAIRRRAPIRSSDFARRLKINKMRSAIARRAKKRDEDDKESDDEKSKDTENKNESKEDPEKKSTKDESAKGKEDEKSESGEEKARKKSFIKLLCPHCGLKCLTFRKYDLHLSSRNHLTAMRKVALKQKSILQQMRSAQRSAQNELEKSANADDLADRTSFCPICKLNYKQKKLVHQNSEAHKNMKKFLMPYCKVCNTTFKSPMQYENHCCSIEHMKRKQRFENGADSAEEDNLENFTTIDSVGDNDDEDDKDDAKPNVGVEQIRKLEVHYCDICKLYLQRAEESEMPKIITKHCKNKVHLKGYLRLKELEKRAEKLKEAENPEKEKNEKETPPEEDKAAVKDEPKIDDEEARDDKMWADVDKDLGDILAEAAESANKSSDEDEDESQANAERYDRFKYSEKNGDDKVKKTTEEVDAKVEETVAPEAKEEKK